MAAIAMPSRKSPPAARMPREATPQQIITSARKAPAGMRGALTVSLATAALMWGAFTPLDFAPLAWICLVPLLTLARLTRPTERMYLCVYLGGLAFWMTSLQWMRLGHPAMYAALVALAAYLALYLPVFVWLTRIATKTLRMPLTLAAPVLWVGLELLRNHLLTGFGWYALGHTQYRWLELIQISDLAGVYGVSFLVVLVSAAIVELLPARIFSRLRLLPEFASDLGTVDLSTAGRVWRGVLCLALFGATIAYGYARRGRDEFQPGLRIALIQGNVPSSVKHDPADYPRIERQHINLTGLAVKEQPDLIVWPETMFRYPLLVTPPEVSDEELQAAHPELPLKQLRDQRVRSRLAQLSEMAGAAMVVGLETLEVDREGWRNYNSAAFIRPDGAIADRYDKLHRVVFGEYIPLADTFPWLHQLTPFGPDFGIDAGKSAAVFSHKGSTFSPIICFEDTVPHLVRDILNATTQQTPSGPRPIDFLVNLTNDGWFHGSSELDQHLITSAFRAVECRVPLVRAVNTGISAIIDGDGAIRVRAKGLKTGKAKQEEAVIVDHVPLDPRDSLYLAWGDWFGGGCLACCGFVSLIGLLGRFGAGKPPGPVTPAEAPPAPPAA